VTFQISEFRFQIVVLLLVCSFSTTGAQQHSHSGNEPKPATLLAGMGRLHHAVATKNPEAQKFFDQGLTFIYAFNHDEAIRSFRRAADLDPSSPMPYWGIALALGPNINDLDVDPDRELVAYEAAQKAKALAARAPANERAYVEALVRRYSNKPNADLKALAVDYKNAMRDLVRKYPSDLDAATLYAESLMDLHPWQLWTADGTPTEGTEEIVTVLESVLKRDAMHIGANHYYIHAVEASKTPDRALPSAQRLDTLVPAAGHLVHMPAHIYMRTGNYEGAVTANAKAAEVDRQYIAENGGGGFYPLMYYNHNLDFLASAAMMSGQFAKASEAADLLVANALPALDQMAMIEPFAAKKLYVLLRFARWDDVLQLPSPNPKHALLTMLSHFGRGVAHAARGNAPDAKREWEAYKETQRAVSPDFDWGYNKARNMFAVSDAVFTAWIDRARGDETAAIANWRAAVQAEDALSYNEPADWFYPTRESLGAALLRAKRYAEAEQTFRDDLARNPKNGRSLFGLWQTLAAQQKDTAAIEKPFAEAWKNADVRLTLDTF
jgi:tetratricopeptide (TPR) repeat protein